jgi:LysR family transcriptional regulator for metE and metH
MMSSRLMLSPVTLRVVAAIAAEGSVTRAARVLNLTQPAVTYHVRQLEEVYGGALFAGRRGMLEPTAIGVRLLRAAGVVLEALESADRDIARLTTPQSGVLRLSSECFTNYYWLPQILGDFRRRYPAVDIQLDVDPSRQPFKALRRGDLDLVLTTVPPAGKAFRIIPLFEDEIVAVMRPEHRLARRTFLDAEDFAEESVLTFDHRRSDLFNLVLRPAGVRPRRVTDVAATEALLEMVKASLGIGVLASWIAQPILTSGELRQKRITPLGLRRRWAGVAVADGIMASPVDHFLALVASLGADARVLPARDVTN